MKCNIRKLLIYMFYITYTVIFMSIFISGVFYRNLTYNIELIIGEILIVGIVAYLMLRVIKDKLSKRVRIAIAIFYVILQIIFTVLFRTDNTWGWDYDSIVMLAKLYVNHEDASFGYLANCPNNILYFLLVVYVFKFSKLITGGVNVIFLLLFNIFSLDLSLILSYKICLKWQNKKLADIVGMLWMLFTPFWIYLPIAYTDIFSIPLYILPIYVYFTFKNNEKKWNYFSFLIIGIIGAIGILFKGNTLIAIIAVCIFDLLNNSIIKSLKKIVIMSIGFCAVYLLIYNSYSNMPILKNENIHENSLPVMHYIYMGLVDDGTWNVNVVKDTMSYDTHQGKVSNAKQKIKEIIEEKGPIGIIKHLIYKEGNIMWNDSLLRGDLYINRNPRHERQVHYFFQDNNIIRRFIKYYSDVYWQVILILILIGSIIRIKRAYEKDNFNILYFICMGNILFFSFWESNSRYLLNIVPFILIIAANTLIKGVEFFNKKTYAMENSIIG